MPTYGYECKNCGYTFDVFQSMKDEPLKICPECGKEIRRLINGGAGVIFKGSGFYVTDSNGKKPGSETGTGESKKTETVASTSEAGKTPPASSCPSCPKADSCPKASGS